MKTISCSYGLTAFALLCAASLCQHTFGDCVPWDAAIGSPGMNASVRALAVMDSGDVIAGGLFSMAGGLPASNIARWDGSEWHTLGDGLNGGVGALLTLPDGDVIAAGFFTTAGDVPANRIARWDGNEWHALGDGFASGTVWALALMPGSGDIVAGGSFTLSGGAVVNRIAWFDGTQWHAMGSGMDATVRTLAVLDAGDGPALYAGGDFLTADGAAVNYIARWDAGASQWLAVDQGVNGAVTAMAAFDDGEGVGLYVAGHMTHAGYVPLFNPVGRWDGEQWWPFSGGLYGTIAAMMVFDDGDGPAMFATATINDAGAVSHRLIKWDGSWWLTVGEIDAPAHALAGDGEVLHVGGSFTMVDDVAAGQIVSWQSCPPLEPVLRRVPSDYATIQSAIDAADDGDVVLVGPGSYPEAINFLGKTIVVESEAGAEKTVIDVTGLGIFTAVTVVAGSGVGTTLRGFTVTGGSTAKSQGGFGVAVGWSTLTIDACRIVVNGMLTFGGGVYVATEADVLVTNSLILGNHATHSLGGGVILSGCRLARMRDCTIAENSSTTGAGITLNYVTNPDFPVSRGMFARCVIEKNAAGSDSGLGGGGAANWGVAFFDDCDFQFNTNSSQWGYGGGLLTAGATVVRNCRFTENDAPLSGGGAYVWSQSHLTVFEDCTFNGNSAPDGGAIGVQPNAEPPVISDSLFCDNTPNDIAGPYIDLGGNAFHDSCDGTLGDLNGDGVVDVSDLLILLAAWGDCPRGLSCPADLNADGVVDVSDLLVLLGNWG